MTRPDPEATAPEGPSTTRRDVLKSMGVLAALAVYTEARVGAGPANHASATQTGTAYIRPPGAIDEAAFVRRCIRCHKCGENCSNSCIRFVAPIIQLPWSA